MKSSFALDARGVTALLSGQKRRHTKPVRPRPERSADGFHVATCKHERVYPTETALREGMPIHFSLCRIGSELAVRESWRPAKINGIFGIEYRFDREFLPFNEDFAMHISGQWCTHGEWRTPLNMPLWASRIAIEVAELKVCRLQDITEAGAIAEGASGIQEFVARWDEEARIGFKWLDNPLVWVLSWWRTPTRAVGEREPLPFRTPQARETRDRGPLSPAERTELIILALQSTAEPLTAADLRYYTRIPNLDLHSSLSQLVGSSKPIIDRIGERPPHRYVLRPRPLGLQRFSDQELRILRRWTVERLDWPSPAVDDPIARIARQIAWQSIETAIVRADEVAATSAPSRQRRRTIRMEAWAY